MRLFARLAVPFILASTPAAASTVLGNPSSQVSLDEDAEVHVEQAVATECDTGDALVVQISSTLLQGDAVAFSLDEGVDYCALTVTVRWAPGAAPSDVDVEGFGVLSTEAAEPEVEVLLDVGEGTAVLIP